LADKKITELIELDAIPELVDLDVIVDDPSGTPVTKKITRLNKLGLWEDLRFPFAGRNIDTSSGRIDYNYYNGGIDFQNNARFAASEAVSMQAQFEHSWIAGSEIRPHLHWLQVGSDEPNWLLAYKIIRNGQANAKETDYSNHTLAVKSSNAYTYTSGTLVQITKFPSITPSTMGISDMIHFVLFRDTANASTLFADVDPSSITELAFEFDVHYQSNTPNGSRQEYVK